MKKNYKVLAVVSAAALVINFQSAPLAAASYDASKAVAYLKSGGIDDWSVMALAASGSLPGVNTDFLKSDPGSSATAIEKRILATVAAGMNAGSHVAALDALYDGTEISPSAGLLNDDIWGLLAFAAAGANPGARESLKSFIKQNQNADGGWGFTKAPSNSDSNDTAMALMALLAAGEEAGSSAVSRGFGFLSGTLSTGFAFDKNFGPDAASTSWAISAYTAAGKTVPQSARSYLAGLQKSDGSFSWQSGGAASPQMTAYAVIALSGKYYPVRGGSVITTSNFEVSVTGPSSSIFQGSVSANSSLTAFSALAEAAKSGGFTYVAKSTALGTFVESIAGISPQGDKGWMYAVNGAKPSVGAAQYVLKSGDKLVWFYGSPGDAPPGENTSPGGPAFASVSLSLNVSLPADAEPTVNLTASKTSIALGDTVQLSWSAQNASSVAVSSPGSWAGSALSGAVTIQPAQTTIYAITVSGAGGTKQAAVQINVDQTPKIVFGVSANNLNFGSLSSPNTAAASSLTITNYGKSNLAVTATLSNADGLYQQALFLNGTLWSQFRENLDANFSKNVTVSVTLPAGYKMNGQKSGTLIFWANPR